jgi:hypothetical protein
LEGGEIGYFESFCLEFESAIGVFIRFLLFRFGEIVLFKFEDGLIMDVSFHIVDFIGFFLDDGLE